MKHLPIKNSRSIRMVNAGIFLHSPFLGSNSYIKVYNELSNSSTYRMDSLDYGFFNDAVYSATNYPELAMNMAKVYCGLRDNGFYHPRTSFMVANDCRGFPSMVCVMPELRQLGILPFDNPGLKDSLEDYIRTYASTDMIFNFNYGLDDKGNTYLIDLHVFSDCTHNRLKFKPQR